MLKIGEFARIAQVSIATLHYYDQCGLLKPANLDPHTSYRYYSLEQLPRLHRIVTLKDLGFPLYQIAQLLEENLSLEVLQSMFRLKKAQTQQLIDTEQVRLARLAARLHQIEQEGTMPTYDMLLKQVDPLLVATLRETISISADLTQHYEKISTYLNQQGISYTQANLLLRHSKFEMYHDGMYADLELAIPLLTSLPDNTSINSRTLPGGLMACTVHLGNTLFLGQAHTALHLWLQENGYHISGPPRQLHLQSVNHPNPSYAIIELQFPIEKQSI